MQINYDQMSPAELQAELVALSHAQADLGFAYARAKAAAVGIEDRKNDMLAKYKSKVEGKSDAERERIVRASPQWDEYRDGLIIAKQEEIHAKIAYEVCVRGWETIRSLMSAKNTERRMA